MYMRIKIYIYGESCNFMFVYIWNVLVEVCISILYFIRCYFYFVVMFCSWGDDEDEYDKGREEDDGYGELEYVLVF